MEQTNEQRKQFLFNQLKETAKELGKLLNSKKLECMVITAQIIPENTKNGEVEVLHSVVGYNAVITEALEELVDRNDIIKEAIAEVLNSSPLKRIARKLFLKNMFEASEKSKPDTSDIKSGMDLFDVLGKIFEGK